MILTNREYGPADGETKCGICGEPWHGIVQCIYVLKQALRQSREANALLTAGANADDVSSLVSSDSVDTANAFPPVGDPPNGVSDKRREYMRKLMADKRAKERGSAG